MNDNSLSNRKKRLQQYLSSQYVDFDLKFTTDRLRSLYSDFSKLKTLNPYGHEANVNYWRAVILNCNLHGYLTTKEYSCFIDRNEISELFYRPSKGTPLCLNHVMVHMVEKTHDLLTQQEFEKKYPLSLHTLDWFRWIYNKPLQWLIPQTASHLYIVLPTIAEYAKIIIQQHYKKPLCSSLDNLFTFSEFKQSYDTIPCFQETIIQLSDLDIWMILRYLHHHYGVDLAETANTLGSSSTVIKFADRNEVERVKAKITSNDKALINLKIACTMLHRQVDELQVKSEEFLLLARQHFKNGRKPQAAYMLKKKKKIDGILEGRLKTLETMETILLKIEASQNDLQVVQAFNMGADALRVLLNDKNLSSIDETIEKVEDGLKDQKQVEEAMTVANQQVTDAYLPAVDEQELEQELNELEQNQVSLTKPINTESELSRLQNVLSTLDRPAQKFLAVKQCALITMLSLTTIMYSNLISRLYRTVMFLSSQNYTYENI
ncbi:hypothetical protein HPULCUR_008784 [Helicostylum pulchrum]|uniref:Vacuolar-sorting protein SNF7 n=1 Tax=Helicostylum pulchrum TaxID=562976 RepID=A0ABP9Y971_9FUNG